MKNENPTQDVPDHFLVNGRFGFWRIAEAEPDRPAVVATDGTLTTAGELLERCNRMSNLLRATGVGHGDAVAAMFPNVTDLIALTLGTFQIGAQLVPINWHLTPPEIAYLIDNSDARLFVAHARFADAARAAADMANIAPEKRFGGPAFPGFRDLDAELAAQPTSAPSPRQIGATMYYTSGTTGKPKGVRRPIDPAVVPEQALARALPWFMDVLNLRAGDGVHLVVAPLYHAAPHSRALQTLHLGHKLVLMEKWSPEAMLELVERHGVTNVQMVPIMFHRLLQLPDEERLRWRTDSLQSVIHAAAPCPVTTKRRMIDWWGPVLNEFYAATEGGGTSVGSADWLMRPGTVGRAYPVSRVAILDDEGRALAANEVGMIYMDDGIGFEYYKEPAKTLASRRNGMFTAGDYGYLDEEGWLFICDRRVDLIISGGVNIYPAEIEAVLMDHPSVGDVAVIGIPDAEWGQSVRAIVEPVAGVVGDEALTEELLTWCADRLAGFKRPRGIDYAVLPRTDAGKISRGKLRDIYLQRAAAETAGAA